MAGTTINIASLDEILKDEYSFGNRIWKNFDESAPTLDLLDKGSDIPFLSTHEGRRVYIPLHTQGNPVAAVPMAEEGQIPSPGRQTYEKATYNLATHAQSLRMTGLSMITASGGSRSVADALALEMAAQPKNARKRMSQLMHGDGSGLYAKCASSQTSATQDYQIVVDDVTQLKVGQEIVIRGQSTGAVLSGAGITYSLATVGALIISAVNTSTKVVDFTDEDGNTGAFDLQGTATYANFALYPYDSQGEAVNGLGIVCSTSNPTTWGGSGNFGDIDRSTNSFWQCQEIDAASTSSTSFNIEDHIQAMHVQLDLNAEELASTWLAFCRYDNWYALGNQLTRDQRTSGGKVKTLTGGWQGLEYGPTTFVLDKDAPISEVRWLAPKTVYRYIANQWYWDDMTGSIWQSVTSSAGKANRNMRVYKANMFTDQQLICAQVISNGRLYGLSASN